jgi:hypothetical protein
MTLYSGLEGSLWIKDGGDWTKVARVKSWGYTMNQEVLDTTVLGDTDRTLIDGVRSSSGSCTLFYYNPDASPEDDTGAGRLLTKILKPLSLIDSNFDPNASSDSTGATGVRSHNTAFRLQADKNLSQQNNNSSSTAKYIWVDAWITSFTMTMAVGEVLSCDVSFEVDGTPIANSFSEYKSSDLTGD